MRGTWAMSAEQLARAYCQHHGWIGREGGWIYEPNGDRIAQGYWHMSEILRVMGILETGKGIHWDRERELMGSGRPDAIAHRMACQIRFAFNRSRKWVATS